MTRERSTWNIHDIAKQAGLKVADPYTMNQDHVKQQPAADAYVIGDPSTFAEDIHPPTTTWEAEYSGGQVKRNEIGMPEMRDDTFNHPEKTASEDVLVKKAAVCVALARSVLPKTASPMDIEEQSISFMHLPDDELMSTFSRLAAKQDQQGQQDQQQQVQAAKQDQQQGQQDQQQQVQAAKQDQQGQKQDQGQQQQVQAAKQDQQQGQQDQQQQVQANFTDPRHTSVRALLAQDQQQGQQQDQGQQQQQGQKQAGQEQQAQMQQQLAQMIQQAQQQLEQLQAAQQQQQAGQQQQQAGQQQQQQAGQQQQSQMQQQSQAQQVAQAVQQAIAQGQDPVQAAEQCMALYQLQAGQQQQQAGQQQSNDGELIDQMLAQQQTQTQPMANMDIELDTPTMDVGEVQLGPEDDMLMQLFANEETQQAQQAQDGGQQQQKQAHAVRTASMRTVGTVPTQGVSRIGGTSTAKTASGGGDNLSSLWSSAPDVREAFGIPTNQ